MRFSTTFKILTASAFAVLAVFYLSTRSRGLWRNGEQGTRVWFYDQSEKQLYAVPADTIPPHRGMGGAANDGVRAVVVCPRTLAKDPRQRKIAYLETYTADLKNLLEQVRAARAAGRRFDGPMPSRDSDSFQEQTLVKRLEDKDWYPANTTEGQLLTGEWRSWLDDSGQPLVPSAPPE